MDESIRARISVSVGTRRPVARTGVRSTPLDASTARAGDVAVLATLVCAWWLAACGDDATAAPPPDAGWLPDTGVDAGPLPSDAGGGHDVGVGDLGRPDLGEPMADGGAPVSDASEPESEGGAPEVDAGPPLPPGTLVVDASDRSAWVYVSIERGVVAVADPEASLDWDLAFRRVLVRTNSGTSGRGVGGGRRAPEGAPFDALTTIDTVGFARDETLETGMPGSTATSMNPVLADWYDYDGSTHRVTPSDVVFVVRGARGTYAKLRIHSWEAGRFVLTLAPIDARPAVHTFTVDASSTIEWVHLDLDAHSPSPAAGVVVRPDAPAADASWDLAARRTAFRTNSGTSGAAMGGAAPAGVDLEAVTRVVPAGDFTVDAELPPSRPGGMPVSANPVLSAWFDYEPMTHTVTPRPEAFLVRLADGSVGALRVDAYASGVYTLRFVYAGPGRESL